MALLRGPSFSPAAGGPPRQLVVLLHGVGADGHDLIELAPLLARDLPHARFVAPDGPQPCDMAPYGRQWFSLQKRRPAAMLVGLTRTVPLVDAFLDEELRQAGLDDRALALVGFSQGTMMSLHVAPRRSQPCAGVVGFSGALVGVELLREEIKSKPPVCLIHGDVDPVVPFSSMQWASDGLTGVGIAVQSHGRPGLPHGIDQEGIAIATRFLKDCFAR